MTYSVVSFNIWLKYHYIRAFLQRAAERIFPLLFGQNPRCFCAFSAVFYPSLCKKEINPLNIWRTFRYAEHSQCFAIPWKKIHFRIWNEKYFYQIWEAPSYCFYSNSNKMMFVWLIRGILGKYVAFKQYFQMT